MDQNTSKPTADTPQQALGAATSGDALTSAVVLRIRQLMKQKGLRQVDLARILGKSQPLVSRWLSGKENFTIDTLHQIEHALGATILSVHSHPRGAKGSTRRPAATDQPAGEVVFLRSEFSAPLQLAFAPGVKAGFPSPAEQYEVDALDFNRDMINHPDTTFYARVVGDSMIGAGINEGDIVVVDRSLEPQNHDVVVAFYNQQYTLKYYDDTHLAEGYIRLVPANDKYPAFKVTKTDDLLIWGVVKYTIKKWRS
jgi:DNA polymerase V